MLYCLHVQNYSCIQKQRLVTDWLVEAEAVEYRWMLMVSMIKKKADKDKSRSVTAPIVGYDQPSSTPLPQFKSQIVALSSLALLLSA